MPNGKKPDCKEPDWDNPDWKELVRERMGALDLPRDIQEDVISELAAHLQETYEAARSHRMKEEEAVEPALQEVKDWNVLAAKIRRAKSEETMNHRTKSLWMPTLASILAASLAMTLLQLAGVRPHLVWTGRVAMSFYWPWLAILPLCGALGAWLSRRDQGTVLSRLIAGLAPVLWLLVLCVMVEPLELAHNGLSHLPYFAYGVTNWILIPGFALLVGTAPFLRESFLRAVPAQPQA